MPRKPPLRQLSTEGATVRRTIRLTMDERAAAQRFGVSLATTIERALTVYIARHYPDLEWPSWERSEGHGLRARGSDHGRSSTPTTVTFTPSQDRVLTTITRGIPGMYPALARLALQERYADAGFGQWPVPDDPRVHRAMTVLQASQP